MIADLDTLLIALYVELTDRIIPARGLARRGPGRHRSASDHDRGPEPSPSLYTELLGPVTLRLREITGLPVDQGGWVLLGERPGEELALGLVGKFWRPVIEYAQVPAERCRGFDEHG